MDAGQVERFLRENGIEEKDFVRIRAGVVEFIGLEPEVEAQCTQLMKDFTSKPEYKSKRSEAIRIIYPTSDDEINALRKAAERINDFVFAKFGERLFDPDPNKPKDDPDGWLGRIEKVMTDIPPS